MESISSRYTAVMLITSLHLESDRVFFPNGREGAYFDNSQELHYPVMVQAHTIP